LIRTHFNNFQMEKDIETIFRVESVQILIEFRVWGGGIREESAISSNSWPFEHASSNPRLSFPLFSINCSSFQAVASCPFTFLVTSICILSV